MNRRALVFLTAFIAAVAGAAATMWLREEGEESEDHETPDSAAAAAATISKDSATVLALAAVPGGTVSQAELETEDNALIYSFDIKVPGKEGVEEIHVDAKTGKVMKHEHESEAHEAAESAEPKPKKP